MLFYTQTARSDQDTNMEGSVAVTSSAAPAAITGDLGLIGKSNSFREKEETY